MVIRSLLVASTLGISSVAFSQGADPEPSASPSASLTPFIVDESQAEKPTGKSTPTPKPDLNFPSNPIAPSTPKPAEASTSDQPSVPRAEPAAPQEILTRLQIFLDQHSFGPGKIDGRWGEFTAKALVRYQIANGQKATGQIDTDLQQQLAKIFPIYTTYTITDQDLKEVGNIPYKPAEQAKTKAMLYRSNAEFLGERYHSDPDFIAKLNKDMNLDQLKAGDVIRVPNVPPFKIEDVKEQPHIPIRPEYAKRMIKVDTRYEGDKLICSFPITPGSKKLPAPLGLWKVVGIATLPWFRWDEAMLEHGYRSDQFYNIPPGPRNPVGILWIGLNKKGIGIHGTNSPDTIGRSGSHGCIRLANWDAARILSQVTEGDQVLIF
jgi:L,D-transpeptidase catalytic domain/Putative peptidoglycan binding domain